MNPFIKQSENILLALSSQILSFHICFILPVLVVWSISHVAFHATGRAADGHSLSPTLSWKSAEQSVCGWQLQAPQRKMSEEGYPWEWRRNLASLSSPTCFFSPLFYRSSLCLHLTAKRRGLEEIAHAFPSEVGLFLLYSVLVEA